ncbi:TatD family hydrolase, partial [Bacteroides sp.]|uniref:TatD family hydrolase n=1 Tax=Bacteroides sp. TaxID=29523 RepID=UPI002FC60C88
PYLAPVPFRGRRNEPTYIWETAKKVAVTYQLTLEETVERTRKNALDLFKSVNKSI